MHSVGGGRCQRSVKKLCQQRACVPLKVSKQRRHGALPACEAEVRVQARASGVRHCNELRQAVVGRPGASDAPHAGRPPHQACCCVRRRCGESARGWSEALPPVSQTQRPVPAVGPSSEARLPSPRAPARQCPRTSGHRRRTSPRRGWRRCSRSCQSRPEVLGSDPAAAASRPLWAPTRGKERQRTRRSVGRAKLAARAAQGPPSP